MKVIIVATVLMLAVLAVGPVAARVTDIKDIRNGDHIFVYETGLNLGALGASQRGAFVDVPTALRKFVDDDVTKSVIKEIPVGNWASFDVSSDTVKDYTGIYYPFNGSYAGYPTGQKAFNGSSISIDKTDLTLGVYLNVTPGGVHVDSLDGKSITRANKITFKIGASNFGTYYTYSTGPVFPGEVDVVLTPPDGGAITVFGANNVNLGKINVTKSEFYTDQLGTSTEIQLTGVTAGTYTAVLKFATTNPDFYKQASNSNSVTFTVLSKPITLTTNKETVVRGNNFAVTITGESNKAYFLYVKSASIANSS
ncbi:MAG: hypothetical protein LUQ49_00995, partial [Methanomicrobiales archaeon]|nr:hypothetical protein [Methanomicrobiales archaeon]